MVTRFYGTRVCPGWYQGPAGVRGARATFDTIANPYTAPGFGLRPEFSGATPWQGEW